MSDERKMNGRNYLRALAYALKAVPTGDEHPDLQHVTFIGDRVVGADGNRWHAGYLPGALDGGATLSATRLSAKGLLRALIYAQGESKHRPASFSVHHDGADIIVEYGARNPIVHPLDPVDVGAHPPAWTEPVPEDAPLNPAGLGHIDCGHLKDAMSWWRSWDKDYGTAEARGGQDGGPVRLDITSGGERVASAFVLPVDHPSAELVEPDLFNGRKTFGKSNLELDTTGDGAPAQQKRTIRIGEAEVDVTGLSDVDGLLVQGPCRHRDTTDACYPCTEEKVSAARAELSDGENDEDEEGKSPPRRRRKAAEPAAPTDQAAGDSPSPSGPH